MRGVGGISMNKDNLQTFVEKIWEESIVPTLIDYIKIPNKSPAYDKQWAEHGFMDRVVQLMCDWCHVHALPGMQLKVMREGDRTPVIYIDIPGKKEGTIMLYGHLDKQPEMTGWDEGLGPWKPVRKGDKLYGRGGADDGYAIFSAITAIKALHEQNTAYPRCVILIEACEESGSYDLPFYLNQFRAELGQVNLIICLDSTAGNYEQLWSTTSLRGIIFGVLTIEVLTKGMHSGITGGVVPNPFLILRQLLTRLEDEKTGEILLPELIVKIPDSRVQQAKQVANILGEGVYNQFSWQVGVKPLCDDLSELILNRTWRAALAVTGADGLPPIANAGNVLLSKLIFNFSMRIPPTCDAGAAANAMKVVLEKNPPYGAKVHYENRPPGPGWNAPAMSKHLAQSINQASLDYFGKPSAFMGEGASIPFMGMLSKEFPKAEFLVTGVLGPQSNAHGPNEFLHIPTGKKVTCCVAQVIAEFK